MYRELLLGCGNKRDKVLAPPGHLEWGDLTTLDMDPNCGADVEWDLEQLPLPFDADEFDELHLYHVLEHTGCQGDWRFFFAQFSEFYRILKPGGLLFGAVPSLNSPWLFGDPGHTRVFPTEILTFLDQNEYTKQVGVTALADYRHVYRGDFEKVMEEAADEGRQLFFAVRAVKPSRITI